MMSDWNFEGPVILLNDDIKQATLMGTKTQLLSFAHLIRDSIVNCKEATMANETVLESSLYDSLSLNSELCFDWLIVSKNDSQTHRLHQKMSLGNLEFDPNERMQGPIITCEFGWSEGLLIGTHDQLCAFNKCLYHLIGNTKAKKIGNETIQVSETKSFPSKSSDLQISQCIMVKDNEQGARLLVGFNS